MLVARKKFKILFDQIRMDMDLTDIKYNFVLDKSINGYYINYCKRILFSRKLLKLLDSEINLVEVLIIHELTHYKFNDIHRKASNPIKILIELRASINAYTFYGLKEESEILRLESILNGRNSFHNTIERYDAGYPTSEEIAKYSSRYCDLNSEVAIEMLKKIHQVYSLQDDINIFINNCLKTANEQHNFNFRCFPKSQKNCN